MPNLAVNCVAASRDYGSIASHHGQHSVGSKVSHTVGPALAGIVLTIQLTLRWKFQTGAGNDLKPSMSWEMHVVITEVENDHSSVLVTVEYALSEWRLYPRYLQGYC